MEFPERKSFAAKAGLCYNCLKQKHRVIDCPSDQWCKVQGCYRKHHSLLHPRDTAEKTSEEDKSPSPGMKTQEQTQDQQAVECSSATTLCAQIGTTKRQVLLSTAEIFVVGTGGSTVKCRALLDSGSDSHILTERLANSSKVLSFNENSVTDPLFYAPGEIDMIIGNEIFFDLVKKGRLQIENSAVTLAETEFGWIVGGSVLSRRGAPRARLCQFGKQEEILNETMVKFWEIEDVRLGSTLSVAEAAVEEHFKDTHARDDQGRYVVRLPFNELKDQLGDSFVMAKKRYDRLMISLLRNPEKRMQYFELMTEYIALGHMKQAEVVDEGGYFIPHHAVYKTSSSTTKTRVVFDASAKTTSGVSLNDAVMVGPTVQSDLVEIILRFCGHQVVLTADVPKMYRQVGIHPDDCKYHKIVWCDENGEWKVFEQLQTVTYGVASSPYDATKALIQLVADEGTQFPLAAQVIEKDSYVDDFLTGEQLVETVIDTYKELSALLVRGGFGVHKFCANSAEVLAAIPEDLQEKQVSFEESGINNTIKTLGFIGMAIDRFIWNHSEDYFIFHVEPLIDGKISSTKREVLSDIGWLFDPLGFLGPVITCAKMIMQDLWRLGLDWDEQLPDELLHQWQHFREELPAINQKQKQRCVVLSNATWIELHGFSDASMRAYGAVVYIRSITAEGTIEVNLVASKSRVAPLKPVTIPRLELCDAKLLAELVRKKIPLALNQFVANRVTAVLELTPGYTWNYIRSEEKEKMPSREVNCQSTW
ncbi:uncharacterized protein LOC135712003 [Ochlerotatus camptorhynchus]|uniref:uncharacterized protein LOC135712003 n=1 Tax=Ochlerotatus camptorhynchus TaxID=644619 RepID=UPI0031DD883B